MKQSFSFLISFIFWFLNPFIDFFLKKGNFFIIYRFGNAIGDHICLTAIAEAIYDQHKYKVIIITDYPEFFYHNQKIYKIIDYKHLTRIKKSSVYRIVTNIVSDHLTTFGFNIGGIVYEDFQRRSKSKLHLRELHSLHFKIELDYSKINKNTIYFTDEEIYFFSNKFKNLNKYAIVQPVGKITYTPNKEWGFENFQSVINTLPEINWIQTGLSTDKLLNNVLDFRGKTKNLRELAWIIKQSDFILSTEGMLNHLASATDTKSFVIFSGFLLPELASYPTTIPIYTSEKIECVPCWLREACPQPSKYCTETILPKQVTQTIKNTLKIS